MERDEFRESVFKRDDYKCVNCKSPGVDAHHIIERRLFDDGGYYIDNGATLCGPCHILAEKTILSPQEIREILNIHKIILPPHLYPDYEYDKWGNIQNANGTRIKGELFFDESVQKILKSGGVLDLFLKYIKYPRTYHLPFSPGKTDDDKTLRDCSIFEGKQVVVTCKMDGECTTGYWDGYVHARSLDSESSESQSYIRNYLAGVLYDLPEGWRICGENLYAKHSIHYKNLKHYFQVYSIWNEKNECLSWEDTILWADLLGLEVVKKLYNGLWDKIIVQGLFNSVLDGDEMEGYVVRSVNSFTYGDFRRNVAKFVRAEHVQTNQHWKKTRLIPNILRN